MSYKLLSTIILQNRFSVVFLEVGQFAAAKLTHYSTKPHRLSDASRPRLRLLLAGDVQQNPGPTTKYPCSVCTRNITTYGVSYMCNNCKNWVLAKCSKLRNTNEYRQDKKWACSSCKAQPRQAPPPSTPAHTKKDGSFTILQFNANGIGNKVMELDDFLEQHNVKVAVIQESKLTGTSNTTNFKNYTTVRKDRRHDQGGVLLTLVHKEINYSRTTESPESLADPHLEELTIKSKLDNTELIISNIHIPPTSSCSTSGYLPSLGHLMTTTDTPHHGTQEPMIREAIIWRTQSAMQTLVSSTGTPLQGYRATLYLLHPMSH